MQKKNLTMIIGVPAELTSNERRVAITPDTTKLLLKKGVKKVVVQRGAGHKSLISDEAYEEAGAVMAENLVDVYSKANVIFKVARPEGDELSLVKKDHILVGLLQPYDNDNFLKLASTGVTGFAMEKLPRISRAQTMDVLSSQANLAGYKAVLVAANEYCKVMPMLMTAAGTVKAARCVIMGVGVAGLQAIATAKRLGCVVEATDVRPETKEQVESLGAKFIEVPASEESSDVETKESVYAQEMSEDYKKRQQEHVSKRIAQADIVITTALIPGRRAPTLISEGMVQGMKPGSVIVDLAVEQGGNCPLSEIDQTIYVNGVAIIGISNLPSLVASDASALYARNLTNFVDVLIDEESGGLRINKEDEIVSGTLVCESGQSLIG